MEKLEAGSWTYFKSLVPQAEINHRIDKIKAISKRVWSHCGEAKTTVVTEKEAAQLQQLPRVSMFHLKKGYPKL